jgi:phytoene dehydrogenase-like protein
MQSKYDVVIVGAGIGGTICGAYLAAGGLKTALFEKNDYVGGKMHADVNSQGYTGWEHWVSWGQGWGGGEWYNAARELDADVRIYYILEPCLYYLGSGQKFDIAPKSISGSGLTAYVESLSPTPLSQATKREFVRTFNYAASIPYKEMFDGPLANTPFIEWKDKLTKDPQVQAFYAAICANSTMCEADEAMNYVSAGGVLSISRFWWMGEAHCVAFKPDMGEGLVKPFGDVMTRNGGSVFLNTEVLEVIVEDDVARGVVVKDDKGGTRDILADKVIVNAYFHDIPKIFKELPPEVKGPVENYSKIPFKDFTLYAGLGRKITDEVHPVSVVDPATGSNRLMVWALSNSFPWIAPQGKQFVFASRVLPLDEEEQKKVSATIKEDIEDIVEEVFPGFKDAIETRFYASHFPLWHYQHTWYKKIPCRSDSVRNLFFVGDTVYPQNSMCADAAASTGRYCAKSILRLEGR